MLLAIRLPWVSTTSWSPFVFFHFGYFHVANNSLCKLNSSLQLSNMATSVFCKQHNPKARLPTHNLRVRSRCLFEWDCFDHRRHATQGTETKRCVTGRRVSRQRACYLALSEDEVRARDLDRLGSGADVNGNTARTQAFESRGH